MNRICFLLCLFGSVVYAQKYNNEQVEEIISSIDQVKIPSFTINISDLGAIGDGKTDVKPFIDKALSLCVANGGGKIIVPKGNFLSKGPIHYENNIELHLSEGSRLVFSQVPEDFLPVVATSWEGTFIYNYSPMIYAISKTNIALTGTGVIEGQGDGIWNDWKALEGKDKQQSRRMNHRQTPINERVFGAGTFLRPQLIQFFDCSNILVQGVRIENSPFWCLHMLRSSNITIRGISFDAQNKNNDGIDLEYANNVLIENVVFNNSDDNIAIKAGRDVDGRSNPQTPSQNIVVRNCKFKGLHAIVIGSEMSAGVKNVFVEDSQAYGFLKRGIYIKTNSDRGGYVKNIYFKNLSFLNVVDAIYMTANYHGEGSGQHASKISDIYLNNISFIEAEDYGVALEGYQSEKLKDIYLSNISIKEAKNPISLLNTKNVVLEEVVIGNLAGVPSSVE